MFQSHRRPVTGCVVSERWGGGAALSGRPLRGGGRLLQGSRWAVRNHGSNSHFPTAECVVL